MSETLGEAWLRDPGSTQAEVVPPSRTQGHSIVLAADSPEILEGTRDQKPGEGSP